MSFSDPVHINIYIYLYLLFLRIGLVPSSTGTERNKKSRPPWRVIRQRDTDESLDHIIESKRLPCSDFRLDEPEALPRRLLNELIDWILKGERGELKAQQIFQWMNQSDGDFQLAAVPKKA